MASSTLLKRGPWFQPENDLLPPVRFRFRGTSESLLLKERSKCKVRVCGHSYRDGKIKCVCENPCWGGKYPQEVFGIFGRLALLRDSAVGCLLHEGWGGTTQEALMSHGPGVTGISITCHHPWGRKSTSPLQIQDGSHANLIGSS